MSDLDDLPDLTHWKTVMEFTIEQAALLMAGLDPFDTTLGEAKALQLPRWKKAHGHAMGIESAIRQGLISPVLCRGLVWGNGWNNEPEQYMQTVKANDREAQLSHQETIITRASLIGWIESENVQITRSPRRTISPPCSIEPLAPAIIDAKPEPLALPYQGHTSEGLEFVEDAIKQLWSTYDPDDHTTAPTKNEVIEYLRSKGAGANMAEAVNLILRPASLRQTGLKNRKVPTRKSE
ncbi:hypothetical protein ABL975_04905 [Pseudomonas aeruginosa]|uniref:hypothetical protein n=1 Tax=Pseudomonas aeruginosa TaxID=287 RepID=UPI000FEFA5B0|nr:hypothetical protein [Pseudomonas aeruginosa]QMX81144.1 hypothetical protein H5J27_31000 [Pseudomonas aeruginosa]RPP77549.1 hypothetical protein IPC1152_16005 [Pseudomonas aeruginosa]UEG12061.1 hypothetical protein LKM46_31105 [Pseudomonas aeruginosa]HCD9747661.1 hypothetical protein [Pseudomonas aeruginosa]HCE3959563.1 hypothetical protein [Pseudomonas aeruginosa]